MIDPNCGVGSIVASALLSQTIRTRPSDKYSVCQYGGRSSVSSAILSANVGPAGFAHPVNSAVTAIAKASAADCNLCFIRFPFDRIPTTEPSRLVRVQCFDFLIQFCNRFACQFCFDDSPVLAVRIDNPAEGRERVSRVLRIRNPTTQNFVLLLAVFV